MDLGLRGQSVLITGGSKGIGLACAREFAAQGCNLHLAARTRATLEAARAELRGRHNVAVEIHAHDLSLSAEQAALAAACGNVDILVNNAGAIPRGDIERMDEARWRQAWELKVFGYINLTRAILPRMYARRRGAIVNIIGLAGEMPMYDYVCGTVGNAALMAFTKAIGSRSVDFDVRVLAVNPPNTATDRLTTLLRTQAADQLGDAERWRELLKDKPFGRAAEPGEIANMVVFLASPRCSYMSGTVVPIDGGQLNRR